MTKREQRLGETFFKITLYDKKGNLKSTKYGENYIKELLGGNNEENCKRNITIKLNK